MPLVRDVFTATRGFHFLKKHLLRYNKGMASYLFSQGDKNRYIVHLQSALLAFIGFGLVAQSIVQFINGHVRHAHLILPNLFGISSSIVLTLIGLVLLYLVPFVYKRREIAFILATAFSIFAIILGVFQRHQPVFLMALLFATVVWLILSRRLYTVKSDQVRLWFGVRVALAVATVGLLYGWAGFMLLGPREFHQHFAVYEGLVMSVRAVLTLQDISTPTLQAEIFIHSLDAIGGLMYILVVTSLFQPVRFALSLNRHDAQVAEAILERSSTSSEDYFKLWPNDKHYYFSPTFRSFLAYKPSGQTVVVLGDPSGDAREFAQLVKQFRAFVMSNGWRLAIINGTEISEQLYKEVVFDKLFIGNEAIITTADYMKHTIRSKHFRYVYNKANREGLIVEQWKELDDERIRQLKGVSDAWLQHGGRKEFTFFMGYFDPGYLRSGSVMVLKQRDHVIAYISVLKTFTNDAASIDHLRVTPGSPSVAMHFLLGRTIELLHAQGKTTVNIGLAPLSGIEERNDQPLLLKLVKKLGGRYYSFEGVEQFKSKSQPVWHERYLYYTGGLVALPGIVRDIERASRPFGEIGQRQRIVAGIALLIIVIVIIQFL